MTLCRSGRRASGAETLLLRQKSSLNLMIIRDLIVNSVHVIKHLRVPNETIQKHIARMNRSSVGRHWRMVCDELTLRGWIFTLTMSFNFLISAQTRTCVPPAIASSSGPPQVLFTDIQSGPTSGGEENQGIYLSIFGTHFWSSDRSKDATRVFIGGHAVARYVYLGLSHGRPDLEQITVQVGSLGHARQGVPLPIVVAVAGVHSNSNRIFTPNPGTIYFADNVSGNDDSGRPGDIHHPYRHVQNRASSEKGVWPNLEPGDFVVLRGTGKPWQDTGIDGYFVRFEKSGTAPAGLRASGPITLMGYPGEDVFIDETDSVAPAGALAGINGPHGFTSPNVVPPGDPRICEQNRALLCSQWITITNLRVEGGGHDGAINLEIGGNHWRVVNNVLTAATGAPNARSGGITGDGLDAVILGNTVHEIDSPDPGLQNHGIYIDGPGSYEIAYNYIYDVLDGSGFQVYGDETPTNSFVTNHVSFHHNWIDNVAKYCINLADNSGSDFLIYGNVSSSCGIAGLRINSTTLDRARIYNNTFYNTDTRRDTHYGAVAMDMSPRDGAVEIRDNIFVPSPGTPYAGGDAPATAFSSSTHFLHNLYFAGKGAIDFDPNPVVADPLFASPSTCNFHPKQGSPATANRSFARENDTNHNLDLGPCGPDAIADIGAYALCGQSGGPLVRTAQ